MACLANILNELPEYLDGKYAPGSSLDHAHGALMTMLKGGFLSISDEARAKAAALREESGGYH